MKQHGFNLSGRTALVTGGSKGIGRAIAEGFARAGADLFLCSRGADALDSAAADIAAETGVRVEAVAGDMAVRAEVERVAGEALRRFGVIDILVNNVGWNTPQAIDAIRDTDWDYMMELNLSGVMAMTRALVPAMKKKSWGRIIHIASIMAMASTPERNGYSATKAGLVAMAKASALDLGPYGITVNCIAPGPIATEMPMSILSREQQDKLAARTAVGRWGRPEELAGPALLLAGEAGSFITGACLVVDGGATCRLF